MTHLTRPDPSQESSHTFQIKCTDLKYPTDFIQQCQVHSQDYTEEEKIAVSMEITSENAGKAKIQAPIVPQLVYHISIQNIQWNLRILKKQRMQP